MISKERGGGGAFAALPDKPLQPAYGLDVVGEHVEPRLGEVSNRFHVPTKVRGEALHEHGGL